jgi:hypothetical protein
VLFGEVAVAEVAAKPWVFVAFFNGHRTIRVPYIADELAASAQFAGLVAWPQHPGKS